MTGLVAYPQYDSYKDSGVDWLGDIPESWKIIPAKRRHKVLKLINRKNCFKNVLSLTLRGVVNNSQDNPEGLVPSDYSSYQYFEKDNLVFKLIDLENFKTSRVGLVHEDGIMSPAYIRLEVGSTFAPRFAYYYFYDLYLNAVFNNLGQGVRSTLGPTDLLEVPVIEPSLDEQKAIIEFLDQKTTQTNEAIALKQKQIALLKERKQILIQNAITKGLNPNAPLKDSGIDWIGQIPEQWEIKRAKYLLKEIDERSQNGQEELLSVSHMTGVTPRSEKNVTMFMAEDYSGSKLCKSGDLVINIMWAWMGALGVSDRTGIVSPSYGIFRELKANTFNPKYLELLLKSTKYVEYYNKVSTGLHSSRLRFYGHMLFAMKIGFASYNEQNEIVNYIETQSEKIDRAIYLEQQQIEKLTEYKTTLINSAVTGKIKITPEMIKQEVLNGI